MDKLSQIVISRNRHSEWKFALMSDKQTEFVFNNENLASGLDTLRYYIAEREWNERGL